MQIQVELVMVDATEWVRRALALLFAVAAALVSTGCATTPTIEPVPVSNFFSVQYFSGGAAEWTWARNDIYVRLPDNRLEYIGSAPAVWGATEKGIQSSRRRGTIAISKDGRSLVFQHWALRAPRTAKLKNGIYQYVYGEGLKQLYQDGEVSVSGPWIDRTYPQDVMALRLRKDYALVGERLVLKATGDTLPLALLEATPLHWAAYEGRTEECVRLVGVGAAPDVGTHWGFTPTDLAIIRGHEETALELLSLGADPGRGIYPALHRAVMLGRINVVKAMLEKGADVNATDKHGYTPLHLAVFAGSRGVGGMNEFFDITPRSIAERNITIPLVQLLLERGADPRIRDNYGKTPLDAIGARTPLEVKELLEDRAGS